VNLRKRKKKNSVRENGHFNMFTDIRVHLNLRKIIFALLLILQVNMIAIDTVEATTIRLQDVPLGSVIYDDTWQIPVYNNGEHNQPTSIDIVEWKVVAKNYYSENTVTLLSNISWGRTGTHNVVGCTWEANNLMAIQKDRFTNNFKGLITSVSVPYFGIRNSIKGPTTPDTIVVNDIYLPSVAEVSNWNALGHHPVYGEAWWTRTHGTVGNGYQVLSQYAVNNSSFREIWPDGTGYFHHFPVVNLDGNTKVKLQGGKYKIIYNQTPIVAITSSIENKYFV